MKWVKRRLLRYFLYVAIALASLVYGGHLILKYTICRGGEWQGAESNHFDGVRFSNLDPIREGSTWDILKWSWTREPGVYPYVMENPDKPSLASELAERQCEATLINHSSFLLRFQDLNLLVDPVYTSRVSPVDWAGPIRMRPVGIEWDALPKINVVLITHDHYDHLDVSTLKRLAQRDKPLFIVPLGNKVFLESHGIYHVVEMDWWDEMPLVGGTLSFTPAKHYSSRYRTEDVKNKTLWGGFYFKSRGGVSVYIAGDTAWTKHFSEIRDRLGPPDLALLSLGAYRPYDLISAVHLRPEEAVLAHKTLGAKKSLGCHFGTWQLADEGYQETLDDFRKGLHEYDVSEMDFQAPNNGQTFRFNF